MCARACECVCLMNPVCQIHVRLKCAKTEVKWPRKLDVIKYSSVIQVQRLLARAISTCMQTHTCITHAQQLIEDVGDKVYRPANHNNVPFFYCFRKASLSRILQYHSESPHRQTALQSARVNVGPGSDLACTEAWQPLGLQDLN